MLDSVTPIISGWWRDFNARDVAQLPLWVCSTADGGSVQLFADTCEQLNPISKWHASPVIWRAPREGGVISHVLNHHQGCRDSD